MSSVPEHEQELRTAVFSWLDDRIAERGDVLEYDVLAEGVVVRGVRRPLFHRNKGIYVPRGSRYALTLRTSVRDPYGDRFDGSDTLVYGMQAEGPESPDNRAVRAAFEGEVPLVYLHQVGREPARFAVVHPVWIVGVDVEDRTFRVETRPRVLATVGTELGGASVAGEGVAHEFDRRIRRAYGTRLIRTRLHQARFRERVLAAYARRCAMCRLRRTELLDAAHIDRDADPVGEPLVTNGLSLCRIHHGAFDAHLLAIEPESLRVHAHPALLVEEDGPMLRHGLQALHGERLHLPRRVADRPDPERLRRHWERFERAG